MFYQVEKTELPSRRGHHVDLVKKRHDNDIRTAKLLLFQGCRNSHPRLTLHSRNAVDFAGAGDGSFRKLRVPKSTAVSVEAMACIPISATRHDLAAEIDARAVKAIAAFRFRKGFLSPISLAHKEMGTVMSLVAKSKRVIGGFDRVRLCLL